MRAYVCIYVCVYVSLCVCLYSYVCMRVCMYFEEPNFEETRDMKTNPPGGHANGEQQYFEEKGCDL